MSMDDFPEDKLLTPAEVAKGLRVANMTVYREIKRGRLRAVRVGRQYRVTVKAVKDYLERQEGE